MKRTWNWRFIWLVNSMKGHECKHPMKWCSKFGYRFQERGIRSRRQKNLDWFPLYQSMHHSQRFSQELETEQECIYTPWKFTVVNFLFFLSLIQKLTTSYWFKNIIIQHLNKTKKEVCLHWRISILVSTAIREEEELGTAETKEWKDGNNFESAFGIRKKRNEKREKRVIKMNNEKIIGFSSHTKSFHIWK